MTGLFQGLDTLINTWANRTTVVGFFISILGFVFTIQQVMKAKNLTQEVNEAVGGVRDRLGFRAAGEQFQSVLFELDELKVLHRKEVIEILPQRYTSIKRKLVAIKQNNKLSDEQIAQVQSTITVLSSLQNRIEKSISGKAKPTEAHELNRVATEQADKLHAILTHLRGNKEKRNDRGQDGGIGSAIGRKNQGRVHSLGSGFAESEHISIQPLLQYHGDCRIR